MTALNTDYAKRQFREAAGWYYGSQDKASIEMQAHAFQGYAAWRDAGYGTNFRDYRRYMGQNKRAAQESFAELGTILAGHLQRQRELSKLTRGDGWQLRPCQGDQGRSGRCS